MARWSCVARLRRATATPDPDSLWLGRPARDVLTMIWLGLADGVTACLEGGAGDGNRTHVSCPAPFAGSITCAQRRSRV